VLERRRETVCTDGRRSIEEDAVHLDRLSARELQREAVAVGLRAERTRTVPATPDYVASRVVILRA